VLIFLTAGMALSQRIYSFPICSSCNRRDIQIALIKNYPARVMGGEHNCCKNLCHINC